MILLLLLIQGLMRLNFIKNLYINNINIDKKSIISISPGGYKGFYQLGIASYIKDNYNTNNYLFSGASAGAWVSLMMVYKGNHHSLINNIINWTNEINTTHLYVIQHQLKNKILTNYNNNEFDLKRIYIGVVQIDKLYSLPNINIYNNFASLEEALDCCIASSHIPFITGGLIKKYKNKFSFDGGFSNYPYLKLEDKSIILHIHPNLWLNNKTKNKSLDIKEFTTLFSIKNFNLFQLYKNGYADSKKNKEKLDVLLWKNSIN